jgi:hypothetical protein
MNGGWIAATTSSLIPHCTPAFPAEAKQNLCPLCPNSLGAETDRYIAKKKNFRPDSRFSDVSDAISFVLDGVGVL